MIEPVKAKTMYIMLREADECSSYHEMPDLAGELVAALDLEIEVPEHFGWGTLGHFMGMVCKALKKAYPVELLLSLFPEYFHANFWEERIDIVGRDLMSSILIEIPVKTGLKDLVTIGYSSKLLASYTQDILQAAGVQPSHPKAACVGGE